MRVGTAHADAAWLGLLLWRSLNPAAWDVGISSSIRIELKVSEPGPRYSLMLSVRLSATGHYKFG